jgi:hypothetical protein
MDRCVYKRDCLLVPDQGLIVTETVISVERYTQSQGLWGNVTEQDGGTPGPSDLRDERKEPGESAQVYIPILKQKDSQNAIKEM